MDASKISLDTELLCRLKAGDEDAFRQVFTRWREPLVRFVDNIIGSRQDAEDICQETFATLWQKRESIDPDKKINTFIFLIAKQITWKYIRRQKHTDNYYAVTDSELNLEHDFSPEEIMQSKEVVLLIQYAISKLPPRTREIFELHFAKGISYEQIAEELGVNTDNVKAQIYRARTKIKEILASLLFLLMI